MAKNNSVKSTDITKVGPMTYRQLQEANNRPYKGVSKEFLKAREDAEAATAPTSLYDARANSEQLVRSSLADQPTSWGESMFDNATATEAQFSSLEDFRAENQPWYAKIGAGLAKGAVLAGTTFLNGTEGLIMGIATAATENRWSGIWDNEFTRAMDTVNKDAEKILPNYYTQNELEQPWYDNIFTANFLGDKLIKNIGFTIGAFYSGNVYSSGLGAIMEAMKVGSNAASMVTSAVGSVMSAVNEGSIEALNAANEFEEKYKPIIVDGFRQRMEAIRREYEANAGKHLVRMGDDNAGFYDPAYVKYKKDVEKEKANYFKALAKLNEDKAKVGNSTLLMNTILLSASNYYQFGKLYSRGFNTAERTANIVGDIGKYGTKNLGKISKVGKILGNGLAEGSEEVEQQIASDMSQHYYATDVNNFYRSLQDPKAAQETLSWTKSFGETLSKTLGEGSTWEQFFIGGLTGLMGMPVFRSVRDENGKLQSPVVFKENAFSKWKELTQEEERNKAIAAHMNERVNSPEFKNYYQGLIRHNKYQNDMNDAVNRDDEFDYKNAEHAQLVSDIAMFSNAGKLDDLKTLINSAYDISDENLQSIIKNTTTTINKDGKEVKVGPFIDENGNTMNKEDMAAELTKQKDTILGTIDEYVETRNKLDSDTGYRFTDEQLNELTWMQTQLVNWGKRGGEMSGKIRDVIGNVLGRLTTQRRDIEAIRTHEGMTHANLSENYLKADNIIQSLTAAIDNLNLVMNLDNDSMAATLAENPDTLEGLKLQVSKLDNDVLSVNDKEDILRKLDDLSRLGNASKIYQDKLAEYLLNPNKQEEDHAEADKDNIDENIKIERAKQVEALNKTANFQEVEALIDNGEATIDDLDNSNSDAAKNYKKASLFRKKATELINNSDSEHKSELLDMLNRRFNENTTYDDLSDESLVTEFPLEVSTWDEKAQETFENEFNNILRSARDKVNSGNSQKQDVEAEKTGIKRPDNVGKDGVTPPPASKPFSVDTTISKIDKLNIAPEVKTEAKALTSQIAKDIEKLSKSKDPKLIRQTQRKVNALSTIVGNDVIADIVDKVRELSKPNTFNPPSQEEVLGEVEAEISKYKPTAVTGVIKSVVPQFDLDAKRDGILIDFVGDGRNQGYSYVYNKLKEVDPKTGKNAFDYVNEGNIKESDELEVRYEPATDEHPELLALYHKGTLVNYMNTDEAIEGVKEIKEKAKKVYEAKLSSQQKTQTSQDADDLIHITRTSQGLSHLGEPREWTRKVGDVRQNPDGFGTHNGLYYYKESISGRRGDNITIWFRTEPSQKVKDSIEQLLSESNNSNEIRNKLANLINSQNREFNTDYAYDKEMSFYDGQIHGTLDRVENGTAIYVDSKGQPVILLAGKSDHQFIGIFREPNSNRWSIKMENKEGDKTIFRDMMSSVMAQLPLGAKIYERTSISVDGLRVFAQQLKHGFKTGNETYETDINGGDLANIFGLSKEDQEAMNEVHISEKELPKVKEILKPYLEKLGVKNIDETVYLTNGNTLSVRLPILIKTEKASSQSRDKSTANPTVRVSKIMEGQYGYDRSKTQSVGDLLGTDDATIGVMKNRSMEANTGTFVEPVFDEANSDGKVYILLPNSKGTLSPKKVYIRHLNKTEFDLSKQDNPIANDLKKIFNDLAGIASLERGFDEALDNVYMGLIELLHIPDSFHINIINRDNEISLQIAYADRDGKRQNRNILLKRFAKKSLLNIGDGTTQASEPYTASKEEVYNQVLDAFYEANLAFNIDAKKLTGKKGQEYANRLRDSNVLTTYLTGKRMQGTWFLLNEKPNTTHTNSAFERAKASQQAKGGTRVQYGGKEYFVRNGIIFDQSGSIVDLGDNAQQVKDIAYINSSYGTNYFGVNQHDGKVLIVDKNGKRGYNRTTNKYLSPKEVEELEATLNGRKSKASQSAIAVKSLQDSQKSVLRDDNGNPDTSNGSYMIKEEDGQYHEYQRVHSVIGSNYIGPSRGDAATSRGSLVDEVARQFLIDPTSVTKPDGMSDEAFGALKRGLSKFKNDANRRGLKLVTDRIVVFHKYSDGRRIAGELDVFAYNPSTGEISIFDFKTSKYSTKDSGFSRVENSRYFTRSNKDQYTLQLSAYAKLFEDSFGISVSNLIIVPFQLKYSKEKNGGISRIFTEDYVPLTYKKGVFEKTDNTSTSQSASSFRTVKGQYVTMGKGKPEYHQADMQVLFTTSNGQTFYLAKIGDDYKLILPNGRSMTIDPSLVSDEAGRTRNNIMDFIQADNVAAAIQNAMSSTPLENSPYGNSIEIKETPKESPKPDDKTQRGLDALDRLNSLKPPTPTKQDSNNEAIDKREKDEKATVNIDLSTTLGRSQLARKKWGELSDAEKAIISPMFEGMKEEDIQKYWDGTDATQRESFIPTCK